MKNSGYFFHSLLGLLLCSLTIGCTTTTDLQRALQSEPIKDRKELQSHLNLPESRLEAIVVGEAGKTKLIEQLETASGQLSYVCMPSGCVCHGDDDCNRMFTDVCRDPSTNGNCSGDPPVCFCRF